jgi:hypothetical protein
MFLFAGHFDQDAAGLYALTVFEMDAGHGFGNGRGQFNRFVGPQCSECLHTVDEAIGSNRFNDDGHGLLSARLTHPKHSDDPRQDHPQRAFQVWFWVHCIEPPLPVALTRPPNARWS